MQDIFLSYSSKDRDRLTPLVDALEAEGWTVFWDHRSIKVAQEWHDVIGAAIQSCPCVIVAWSANSVQSRWVKEEALIARDRGVLYPVMLDHVPMPFGFTLIQAAQFQDWDGQVDHPEFVELREQLSLRLNLRRSPSPVAVANSPESELEQQPLAALSTTAVPEIVADAPSSTPASSSPPVADGVAAGTSGGRSAAQQELSGFSLKGLRGLGAMGLLVMAAGWVGYAALAGWFGGEGDTPPIVTAPATTPQQEPAASSASTVAVVTPKQEPTPTPEPVPPPEPEPPKRYGLVVSVTPPEATVTINGQPYDAEWRWPAGTYTVRAEAPGYKAAGEEVSITDKDREARLVLEVDRLAFEPEMVLLEGGTFTMGCVEDRDVVEGMGTCYDDEKPPHRMTVSDFKLARTEVTVGQFRAFVEDTNYKTTAEKQGSCWSYNADGNWGDVKGNFWGKLGFEQNEDHPVTCVSWDDAQAYVDWLAKKTGKAYRLPTESEWEYAARAGSDSAYFWGSQIGQGNANCRADLCGDSFKFTAPAGSFAENPLGLHDMHGNVWEWVEDRWHSDYKGASTDGSAWTAGDSSARVLRGGSWRNAPRYLRSANRGNDAPDNRGSLIGFRPAHGL